MAKKISIKEKNPLILKEILQNIIDICADKMKIDRVEIKDAQFKNNQITLIFNSNKKITKPASIIYFLLKDVFQYTKGFKEEILWEPTNADTSVYGAIAYGKASEEMLKLIEFLYNEKAVEEARLCALQSQIFEDFKRYNSLGKKLFEKIELKSEKISNKGSSSPTKLVENVIPFTKSENIYEIIYAVTLILSFAADGLFHFSGKRREKLLLELEKTEQELKGHFHPVVQAYSKLLFAELDRIKQIF